MKPMAAAKSTPMAIASGVTLKANATSLNEDQLVVLVVMALMGRAIKQPSTPPIRDKSTDSRTNDQRTAPGEKPSTIRVAISRVRAPTAAYIVFMAPKM